MSQALDGLFAALAEPSRRRIVELLRERPRRAGELAGLTGLSPPALSRHLRTLRETGLVEDSHPRFDARVRVYALKDGALESLKSWLAETEALWERQLASFQAHLNSENEG